MGTGKTSLKKVAWSHIIPKVNVDLIMQSRRYSWTNHNSVEILKGWSTVKYRLLPISGLFLPSFSFVALFCPLQKLRCPWSLHPSVFLGWDETVSQSHTLPRRSWRRESRRKWESDYYPIPSPLRFASRDCPWIPWPYLGIPSSLLSVFFFLSPNLSRPSVEMILHCLSLLFLPQSEY